MIYYTPTPIKLSKSNKRFSLLLLLFFLTTIIFPLSTVFAQETISASQSSMIEIIANDAITEWQETSKNFSVQTYLEKVGVTSPQEITTPEDLNTFVTEICQDVAVIGPTPSIGQEMNINFEDLREKTFDGEGTEGIIQLSYPASIGETIGQVEVNLFPTGDNDNPYEAGQVRFNILDSNSGSVLPNFFDSPYAGWVFVVFSLFLIYAIVRKTFFRHWLTLGWQAIQEHKRLVIATSILLYGLFALGLATGLNLPEACIDTAIELITGNLDTIGIVEHLQSGDVLKTAAITAAWNFVMGAFSTTFIPALLLGIPAYFLNALRFFGLAIPFASVFEPALILHLPTLIIELMAYIIVTAGGGMLLVTLIKKGFKGLPEGLRKLWLMLPIALVLLVIGAWYESFSLIVLHRLLFGS